MGLLRILALPAWRGEPAWQEGLEGRGVLVQESCQANPSLNAAWRSVWWRLFEGKTRSVFLLGRD